MGNSAAGVEVDTGLRGLVASLPEVITMEAIAELEARLSEHQSDPWDCILLDTNQHAFESIACIKALRRTLEGARLAERGTLVAFVAPAACRPPEIVSSQEAYFSDVDAARSWLEESLR
ncbi:MAG: hypothetical protein ACRBN8_40040 [Nannocystales bacterium]